MDERAFAHELADLLQLRALRLAKFKEVHRKLKDAGYSIESALQMIKGQQIENFAITLEDFVTVCQAFDVPFDAETELGPILSLLAVDQFGQVAQQTFVDEFNKCNKLAATLDTVKPVVAHRNFDGLDSVLHQVAREIEAHQMVSLGSYLKDNDFANANTIASSVLFEILQTRFETLDKGDILDFIEHFEQAPGQIDILTLATTLNRLITQPSCQIRLEARELIDE